MITYSHFSDLKLIHYFNPDLNKCCIDCHEVVFCQKMNPNDFNDALIFPLAPA